MPFYEKGNVRIHYQEVGSGFPLMVIPGGGLNRTEPGLEIDRPWDAYTDDHIGLMDHLGIGEFLVLGFCIGGCVWPGRVLGSFRFSSVLPLRFSSGVFLS